MKYVSYCYEQSEPTNNENECHIDRVMVIGEDGDEGDDRKC